MAECFKCGLSSERTRLFDAISDEGVVKMCEACSKEENLPIVKKPTTFQLKEAERKGTVYERLAGISGIKYTKAEIPEKKQELKKQEITLKDIVDKNYMEKIKKADKIKKSHINFIDNFHWVIMRARRLKKLTQKQLAKEIQESEAAIKMAEQGILPEDDYKLINKLEAYLGIKLKEDKTGDYKDENEEKISLENLDMKIAKELTISDLKEIKDKKEESEISENEADFLIDEENLSNEDIDDLISGRK